MSIEDVTFRCNLCGVREVVMVSHGLQEAVRLDGTIHTPFERYTDPKDYAFGEFKILFTQDRLRVEIPKGWERRFGETGRGRDFLHLCQTCAKKGT